MLPHDAIGQFQLIHGDARRMIHVDDGEASLVVTSPPYFPEVAERELFSSRVRQQDPGRMWSLLLEHAASLAPAYREMSRIAGMSGIVAIETKDIRFGDWLLPLAALHARQAMEAGFWIRCRIWTEPSRRSPSHTPSFAREPMVGTFRTYDSGEVLICAAPGFAPRPGLRLDAAMMEWKDLMEPRWRLAPAARGRAHPHQSPPGLVRRLIRLFTIPGDLVVDPFAGSGQVLRIASKLGRRAVGYEIDPARVADFHERHVRGLRTAGGTESL